MSDELPYYNRECPNCHAIAEADFVDIGVGMQQCGPFHCDSCGWIEENDLAKFVNLDNET